MKGLSTDKAQAPQSHSLCNVTHPMGRRSHASKRWEEQENYHDERHYQQEDRGEKQDESHQADDSDTAGLLSRRKHSKKREKMQRPSLWGRIFGWRSTQAQEAEDHVLLGGTERMRLADEIPSKGRQRRRGCFVFGLVILVIL